jgi:hypothetical protein
MNSFFLKFVVMWWSIFNDWMTFWQTLKDLIALFSRKNFNSAVKNCEWSISFATLKDDIQIQRKSSRFWIDFLVKTLSTFVNLSKFACSIEFSLRILFSLLSRFMLFWKRMYFSYEIRFSRKQWIFSRLLLSILSLLFSSIMRLMWSYSRWTRVLKIEKKSWWFCAMKKNIRCVMKAKSDQTSRKNTTSSSKNVARFLKFWKRFVSIFMTWNLFWKQMRACSSINWIDLIQIFLMRSLLVNSLEFDFLISKFVTFSISSILLQTICSENLRRLMILRKSLKKKTLTTEWTFNSIAFACSLSRLQKRNSLRF